MKALYLVLAPLLLVALLLTLTNTPASAAVPACAAPRISGSDSRYRGTLEWVLLVEPTLAANVCVVEFVPTMSLWNNTSPTGSYALGRGLAAAEAYFGERMIRFGADSDISAYVEIEIIFHELCHLKGYYTRNDASEEYASACAAEYMSARVRVYRGAL